MPQPNVKDLIVAGPLANVSVAYRNRSYIADRVFPVIDNISPKAKIARYLKGAWFRDEAGIRGPGGEAMRGGYPVDLLSISTKEYAFAKEVTDEDRKFANSQGAPPLKPDQDALEFCADKIDLSKERRVASMILAGTWSGVAGEDAAGLWAPNDATNTFIADVLARIETIRAATGLRPNVMVMDFGTYNTLKKLDALLDRIKYTQRGILTVDLIAAMFDLDEVLLGEAIYSSAKETKAGTDWTSVNVWEKTATKGSAFLYYRPSSPGLKTPSAGYQARVAYDDGGIRRSTTWREPARHQDVYEVAEETDIVQTGTDLGFLWYDTILT
ncbi:hypothetical protein [Candidatus Magnetobacterium casense]|uniref:Uncharacterized protein n=1 Tax=Candidatus Magnetobacterium casense TaxID=1455061 RepID=A0ABS6S3P6_9BACT|nr:hypothetical protein [Candidatus Magnetobacterium casensis]MBV6343461.1 hypothetical protein [Candidatus Magnetobacterium casensis]